MRKGNLVSCNGGVELKTSDKRTCRVAFIDGHAGEGRYQDGNPGSPLLLASQATRAQMFGRDVKLAFVERDASRREAQLFNIQTIEATQSSTAECR